MEIASFLGVDGPTHLYQIHNYSCEIDVAHNLKTKKEYRCFQLENAKYGVLLKNVRVVHYGETLSQNYCLSLSVVDSNLNCDVSTKSRLCSK